MKILVLQVKIGIAGYVYGSPEAPDLFEKHLMPTVVRYCKKHGYDYKLVEEYPNDHDLLWFNFSSKPIDHDYSAGGKNKSSTLVRYLNMHNSEYDAIVSLDCDVYISPDAEPLPKIDGHMAVKDLGKSWETFRKNIPLPHDTFVNAGVQMVSRDTSKHIYDYFAYVAKNKVQPIDGYHSDQSYMNYFRSQHPEDSKLLDYKWNYMVGCHKRNDEINPFKGQNFVHYAGQATRSTLINDIKNGIIL